MSEPIVQCDPTVDDADRLLEQADAVHDDEPARALQMLRHVAAANLPPARLERLAFLLNHVLGEKFELWAQACAAQRTVIEASGASPTPTLLRQAAIAAQIAGDAHHARAWTLELATRSEAPLAKARALVTLGAVAFAATGQDAETAGRLTLQALQPLAALHASPGCGLDAAFGAVANDLAGALLERPLADLEQADLRTALALTAEHAQRFWQRAGQWIDVERAHYLRAMSANALGLGAQAAAHARAGLELLDEHDAPHTEDVDRAFLELELAQGLHVAELEGGDQALDRAHALARAFAEPGLAEWFARRSARNAALAAHYGRH